MPVVVVYSLEVINVDHAHAKPSAESVGGCTGESQIQGNPIAASNPGHGVGGRDAFKLFKECHHGWDGRRTAWIALEAEDSEGWLLDAAECSSFSEHEPDRGAQAEPKPRAKKR
jgi:hypothetical protein